MRRDFLLVSGGFLLAWMLFLNMGAGLIGNTLMLARLLRVSCSTFKASQLLSRMKKQNSKNARRPTGEYNTGAL